jgi:outer membrane protein OmpA-like peptidoglycan-associated protein
MEFASKIRIFRSGDQIKYEGGEIDFETGSSEIKGEETKYIISQLAKLLKKHSDIKVRIEGHTDSRGSTKLNQKLSEDRANTIRINLILQGIDDNRISVNGFGEVKPMIIEPEECFNKLESKVPIGKLDFCYDVWKVNPRTGFVIFGGGN